MVFFEEIHMKELTGEIKGPYILDSFLITYY